MKVNQYPLINEQLYYEKLPMIIYFYCSEGKLYKTHALFTK